VKALYRLREVIDLRSDTMTRPSRGMREAMANAEVGDEQWFEDPTVTALERRVAALLGHEASVYLPTAMMANEIALVLLGRRGTELIAEASSHIMTNELGGPAVHAGLQTRGLVGERGRLSPEQIRETVYLGESYHTPTTSVVALENTHNRSGGLVWPLEDLAAAVDAAHELGLRVHLDGARMFNAAVALGVPPAAIAAQFDTVQICLSKGLGCPLGALIAGSQELMQQARVEKHRFGGAMRQAGIVAAAGLYALDHNVDRLADDHARARRLAEGWDARGVPVDLDRVETNFVRVDVAALGLSQQEAIDRLAAAGVGLSWTAGGRLRAVTHLDVSDEDVDRAFDLVPEALGVLART
jgi:threonine aldolase